MIRVVPRGEPKAPDDREWRLRLFDQATERLRRRRLRAKPPQDRGWRREGRFDTHHSRPCHPEAARRSERSRGVRNAIRACAAYQLNWFDAHLWSYAEHYDLA